ncbi:MAG: hypothetical protein ACRDPK_13215 [Carbonactinosporaceae bacterium]
MQVRRRYETDAGQLRVDGPDVLLDVPVVKVDEINLEVDNLRARVSLQAEVLDLLRLNVGADVELGRVALDIKGVEAQALLKVRLDNVKEIIERVLTTIDENPQILEHVTRGLESTLGEVGGGARQAAGELGRGAGGAVEDVGAGTGEAAGQLGQATGQAAQGAVNAAGQAARGGTPLGLVMGVGATALQAGREARGAVSRAVKAARKAD